jgi:hypothetical protein
MATVIVNLNGFLVGLLQLFLRTNTAMTAIRPKNTPGWLARKHEIRLFGPNDLGFDAHMLRPVSGPQRSGTANSATALINAEKGLPSMSSVRMSPIEEVSQPAEQFAGNNPGRVEQIPKISEPCSKVSTVHGRKQTYSLFPFALRISCPPESKGTPTNTKDWRGSAGSVRNKMAGVFKTPGSRENCESGYSRDDLLSPPPIHFEDERASVHSSATVQIGLRISDALYNPDTEAAPGHRASSPRLQIQTRNLTIDLRSPLRSSILQRAEAGPSKLSKTERDARMKTLPPIPRSSTIARESKPQLSPTVYSVETAQKVTTILHPPPSHTGFLNPWRKSNDEHATTRVRGSKLSWI